MIPAVIVISMFLLLFILSVVLGRWIMGIYLLLNEIKRTNTILSELNESNNKQSKAIADLLARIE